VDNLLLDYLVMALYFAGEFLNPHPALIVWMGACS
jgi:hypothetical protein